MKVFINLTLTGVLCLFSCFSYAQDNDKEIEKLNYRAEKLIRIRNYDNALQELLKAVELGDSSPLTYYNIGLCYINHPEVDDQIKAKEYFEYAINQKNEIIPDDIYLYLGKVYHKDLEVSKAINAFKKYKETLSARDPRIKDLEKRILVCNNALDLITNYKGNVIIKNLGSEINSPFTEYNSVVSADETTLAFTRLIPEEGKGASKEMIEEIFIATKPQEGGKLSKPSKISFETDFNIGTAGLTPDGETMLVFIGGLNNTGDLYSMNRTSNGWSNPVTLGNHINSKYLETTASVTPDNKVMYFSSNRPGGHGGLDIYKIEKNEDGSWGYPVNLGPTINSAKDEDAPFIHPDQKTLFFTSNGHNTMGGKDIFKTTLMSDGWNDPVNMGFPINTPADDNYFTLTADGSKGYLSSDRSGGFGGQDIYTFDMPEEEANIPLTLIKGRILDAETRKPVPTKIKVIDNETSKKVDYVYNPNPETGNYLIIFPPGKNYDMVIESEKYMPYTLNINIPNQTYFYELYQEITLKAIKHFEVVVGQEISVKNVFFDSGQKTKISARKANEAMLIKNDSVDLYDLMDAIISSTDSVAFNYLLDLMYETNPIDDIDFDSYESNEDLEYAKRTYYYDESDTSHLESRVVEGEIIYSLPTLYVTEENAKRKEQKQEKAAYNKELLEPTYNIYFDVDESELKKRYAPQLKELLSTLNEHKGLGIEVSGYASPEGDADYNRKLSNKRAIEVVNYFNHRGIVRRRIIAKGYGASQNENISKEKGRRVEIRLVDLSQYTL